MNLPNKLTTFRVILIPFFVFFLLAPYFEGACYFYCRKPDGFSGRKNCKKVQSCNKFRKVYGPAGRQAFGLLCTDLFDCT